MKGTKDGWKFDTRDLNPKVRPQDDFYMHASGGWLKHNPIPKNESRWGSFMILRFDTEKKLMKILKELQIMRAAKAGSPERMIRDFYTSGMDMKRRNALGIRPLAPWLKRIADIRSSKELQPVIADLHRLGVGVFFGSGVDQDSKDSTKYILHIAQDGLGMPDRDYYLNSDKESTRVRKAYVPHIEAVFRLAGSKPLEAKKHAQTIMGIETRLAKHSMNKVDRRDAEKTYHKKTPKQLASIAPNIDWNVYLKRTGVQNPKSVIVMQPLFLTAVSKLLKDVPLEDLKTYLTWHVINDHAGFLSEAFVKQSFAFYGTTLGGTKVMKPLWRRTLSVVNGALGELLGKIYVKKHFTPEAKRKMNIMVDDLFAAYASRIKALDWMSPGTKKKALLKLRAMNRKIGYPDTWKSYAGLVISADDYLGNAMRTSEYEHNREIRKLGKPIDRGEWFMYPQTVNAYNAPNMNDIAFPAAILQPPYFDPTADDAMNYGSIGTVIGHEITHGFDDDGSKFDANGNLKSWWTKQDKKRFEKKAALVVKQFNQYSVAGGVKVNGKLTLGENIADMGGLAIAFEAYQTRLKKTGRKDIGGYTPEQRFFLSFTLFDREISRPEFEKMAALTDRHSPAKFRINGPVSNLVEFYDAFNVMPGDTLYRAPSGRAKIW